MNNSAVNILAMIPARGGSKSIPRKNLVSVAGQPLIKWTIDAAKSANVLSDIVVSSDDSEILAYAKSQGVIPLQRPVALAGDNARSESAVVHAIDEMAGRGKHYDWFMLLQPTSPLRGTFDIDSAMEHILHCDSDALISVTEPSHSPLKSFLLDEQGHLQGIVNNDYPFMPRQELPPAYTPNGAIYIVKIERFKENQRLFQAKTSAYVMPSGRSVDIDSVEDIRKVERLIDDGVLKSQGNEI